MDINIAICNIILDTHKFYCGKHCITIVWISNNHCTILYHLIARPLNIKYDISHLIFTQLIWIGCSVKCESLGVIIGCSRCNSEVRTASCNIDCCQVDSSQHKLFRHIVIQFKFGWINYHTGITNYGNVGQIHFLSICTFINYLNILRRVTYSAFEFAISHDIIGRWCDC